MANATGESILERIHEALLAAGETVSSFGPGKVASSQKSDGRGPVTAADHAADRVLREMLVRDGESWLSEESVDDFHRLVKTHLWIVDPLDGTTEFVAGIPEWCISVGWIEHGRPVAGGIYNPATRELFLGSISTGVIYNGQPVRASNRTKLSGAVVLASRSEVDRGQWDTFRNSRFTVRPTGSIGYKLGLVAAGLADATWTLCPKNEWDIAAGVALVESSGGFVQSLEGFPLTFNHRSPLLSGVIAGGAALRGEVTSFLNKFHTNK